MIKRKITKEVKVGDVFIGGSHPIVIQSMLSVPLTDYDNAIKQYKELEKAGCEIIRFAVPDEETFNYIDRFVKDTNIPVVADIHFNYRWAIKSIELGVDKIRINPGNIGGKKNTIEVIKAARERNIPIRIGINSGSLPDHILEKYSYPTVDAMVESMKENVGIFEDEGYTNIVLSAKSSDPMHTVEVYRKLSEIYDYPLHIGVTEAGPGIRGIVKSVSALTILLNEGIGDTIRVSLSSPPTEEVKVARYLLKSLGISSMGVDIISCPTCGRCGIDVISIANEVENRLDWVKKDIKIAVMGCVVNGPDEAKFADIGIAGGNGVGILFKKGEIVKNIKEEEMVDTLVKEVEKMVKEGKDE